MVPFPLPPVGFAQPGGHRFALVLDRDDEPRFFLRVAGGSVLYADGLVRPFGDDHGGTGLDIDGFPRLVQLEAERLPITRAC